jgi:hypothetical protein
MQYPLEVTETPHRGASRTWVLENEAHLQSILNGSEACRAGCNAHDLESYIEWLRADLRSLDVQEL